MNTRAPDGANNIDTIIFYITLQSKHYSCKRSWQTNMELIVIGTIAMTIMSRITRRWTRCMRNSFQRKRRPPELLTRSSTFSLGLLLKLLFSLNYRCRWCCHCFCHCLSPSHPTCPRPGSRASKGRQGGDWGRCRRWKHLGWKIEFDTITLLIFAPSLIKSIL